MVVQVNDAGMVDRLNEGTHDDATITVTLDCGFTVDFFEMGLTDEEYIERTKSIKELESYLDEDN